MSYTNDKNEFHRRNEKFTISEKIEQYVKTKYKNFIKPILTGCIVFSYGQPIRSSVKNGVIEDNNERQGYSVPLLQSRTF